MGKALIISESNKQKVKDLLSSPKPTLIWYHMNMCPHCVAMKGAWDSVEQQLSKIPGIQTACVEYSEMHVLPSHLRNIRGFPTIQLLENGKVKQEYSGDRSAKSIIEFVLPHIKKPTSGGATGTKKTVAKKTKKTV